MTAFDDDPEYEAQLRDVLGDDQLAAWRDSASVAHAIDSRDEEMGDFVKDTDNVSEDGVLNDMPNFRLRGALPSSSNERQPARDDDDDESVSVSGRDDKILSEDARSISTGDDSPSVPVIPILSLWGKDVDRQGSEATLSAPVTPSKLNGYGYLSPARAFSPSRGFDIRQHQRLSSFSSQLTRSPTPSSVHSRMSSFSGNIGDVTNITTSDSPNVPWEVVRWTKLRKIVGQAFSEIGKRKFGTPTVLAVPLSSLSTPTKLISVLRSRSNRNHKRPSPSLRL